MRPAHVVVIGGGIAGLAAAHRLRRLTGDQVEITIVDQSRRLGGKLSTVELAGSRVDVGAEAFVTRRPEALELVTELGLDECLVHPELTAATVHAGGRTVPLPTRTFLGVPSNPDDVRDVLSPRAVARVAAEADLPPLRLDQHPDGPDVPVGTVLGERLGRELVDRLVEPLLGGVYAGRADELGLRATMPALVAAIDHANGSLTAAAARVLGSPTPSSVPRQPVFGALRGGLGDLVDRLVAGSGARPRLGLPVRALHRPPDHEFGWRLEIGSAAHPEFLPADAVVLAVPAPAARRLLGQLAPAASAAYGRIGVASMAVVTLALPPGAQLPRSSGVLLAVGERHADRTPFTAKAFTFTSRKWGRRDGQPMFLRASIGRYGEASVLQREDAELITAICADLAELTGVIADPVEALVTRWGGGLPQYGVQHGAAVAEIEHAAADLPGLAVAGAALHGVGIPACIGTGQAAAARVTAYLAAQRLIAQPGQSNATMNPWPA